MARLEFTAISSTNAATTAGLTLESIPQDVRDDVEEVYAHLKANPGQRMRTPAFATKTDALTWVALAQAYCKLRPAGEIRFRKSPTKNLPDTVIDFRITDVLPDNGTDGVREAVAAVAEAAKAVAPPAKAAKK